MEDICTNIFYQRELVRDSKSHNWRFSIDSKKPAIRKSEQQLKEFGQVFRQAIPEGEKVEIFTKIYDFGQNLTLWPKHELLTINYDLT